MDTKWEGAGLCWSFNFLGGQTSPYVKMDLFDQLCFWDPSKLLTLDAVNVVVNSWQAVPGEGAGAHVHTHSVNAHMRVY